MRRLIRWLIASFAGLFALVVVALLVLSLLHVTVDLNHLRGGVETSAGVALGRDVKINGAVQLELSGWPSIEVQDVEISNVPGAAAAVFFSAKLARLQIGLPPLLRGDLQIGEITAESVVLNLENDAEGRANWVFGEQATKAADTKPRKRLLSFAGLHELSMQQVEFSYHDAALGKTLRFTVDSLYGEASPGKPMHMKMDGVLQEQTYQLKLSGGPVDDLLDRSKHWPFTLIGEAFGRHIDASGSRVVKDNEPDLGLQLVVEDADIGAILDRFGLVEGMEMTTGVAAIDVLIRGNTLNEIVVQSKMVFAVRDGEWVITLPNTDKSIRIQELKGDITVKQGSEITMDLQGELKQTPVRFLITGAPLVEYMQAPEELPLKLEIEMLDARLSFDSKLAIPVTNRDVTMMLEVEGKRLDKFNELFKLDLPPLGPVSLTARLDVSKAGYELSMLKLIVGESDLAGRINVDTTGDKPTVDMELVSSQFRVEDFDVDRRKSPEGESTDTPVAAPGETDDGQDDAPPVLDAGESRHLLSREVLETLNADLSLEAKQVVSGKDKLGSGSMRLLLQDGRLALEPLQINIPGGGVNATMSLLHRDGDVDVSITASIDHFDYGVLARRVDAETDMGGVMSLDVVVESTAPAIADVMAYANGHFDFALLPENFSADVFDMWAVNLISAVATEVDKDEASKVNCIVVRLGLEAGLLTEKAVFMDTTQMSVAGKVDIDFKAEEIDILMAPKAKRPEFFSLATPIKVQGSFDDFGVDVGKIRAARSVISFITSPIHVPIRRVFKKEVPADGREACELAWKKTADEGYPAEPVR
jgi:uncharacterized protein involved in outer membrane biogenesis